MWCYVIRAVEIYNNVLNLVIGSYVYICLYDIYILDYLYVSNLSWELHLLQ